MNFPVRLCDGGERWANRGKRQWLWWIIQNLLLVLLVGPRPKLPTKTPPKSSPLWEESTASSPVASLHHSAGRGTNPDNAAQDSWTTRREGMAGQDAVFRLSSLSLLRATCWRSVTVRKPGSDAVNASHHSLSHRSAAGLREMFMVK